MSAEQTPDIAALAVDICSHSGRHVAGFGSHDAEQWGACSQCTHYARVVAPVLAAAVREAEQRAWDEAADAAQDSITARWLRHANPYRADRITEPVSHEAATSGEEADDDDALMEMSLMMLEDEAGVSDE